MHLETHLIDCPYCGESIELTLEPQDAEQVYFEDCRVCCQPIHISVMRNEFCDSYYLHCKSADD